MSDNSRTTLKNRFSRFARDYGMLGVLVLLCVFFSALTVEEQHPVGEEAAKLVADQVPRAGRVLIVGGDNRDDSLFVMHLSTLVGTRAGVSNIQGDPGEIRRYLTTHYDSTDIIVTTEGFSAVLQSVVAQLGSQKSVKIIVPPSYRWPTFLLANNIRNVANQIAVIALIAIGMTMVIITAGIDLSVGSLIALSAVFAAWLIGHWGGENATSGAMVFASFAAVALCGATGAFSGLMITRFGIPPFIATLAMMQVAAGVGYIISEGKPIYQIPQSFTTLGRGVDPLLHVPYAVILMAVLYVIAHLVMSRTVAGRYIYAVGGNAEAARLAGIRVKFVLFSVYTICGMLAGLGGIVLASQLKSGAPTYGLSYELYVIAAVVVGGTSLSGGEGRIFGTLIGAFVIAVIQNGMNLTNVETYTQKVVLGLVILGAVLLDRLKQHGLNLKWMRT